MDAGVFPTFLVVYWPVYITALHSVNVNYVLFRTEKINSMLDKKNCYGFFVLLGTYIILDRRFLSR